MEEEGNQVAAAEDRSQILMLLHDLTSRSCVSYVYDVGA